ncbi:MAG TPA: BON domain-containing protein [bacterium]|nr:BON domain-containing protein [bacterium]
MPITQAEKNVLQIGKAFRTPTPGAPETRDARDTELEALIRRMGLGQAPDLHVVSKGGFVTLTGTVHSREAKHQAAEAARLVPGVKEITNHLRVRGHRPAGTATV